MQTLRECIEDYKKQSRALGHFNVSDANQLEAIARAAKETKLPVLVGLSEGERAFFPIAHARLLIDAYRAEGIQLYLNADHTYSTEKVAAAIQDGVESVVVDGAKLSFDDNVALVRQCVALAKAHTGEVLVEGELGYIGTSSTVMTSVPAGAAITEAMMTRPEDLNRFVLETGIDLVAPAVGNIHGIVTNGQPKLSIARISQLASMVDVPLVLHGGSGSSDEEFAQAVAAGISIIHINTDIRLIYRDGLKDAIAQHPDVVAPYKFLEPVVEKLQQYLMQKMRLFARM